jgi:hypothetical protein
MRPFVSWCVALLLLTVAAAAQNQLGVEERAALDAIYGNLELAPLTLDKPLLSPAGPIRARAAFVSTATKEMALPSLSKSFNGGGHIIGFVSWFVKRVDIPVPPAKSQSPYGERSGPGVVTRIAKIVPGENTQLESFLQDGPPTYAFEHVLDLKRLNLESAPSPARSASRSITRTTRSRPPC